MLGGNSHILQENLHFLLSRVASVLRQQSHQTELPKMKRFPLLSPLIGEERQQRNILSMIIRNKPTYLCFPFMLSYGHVCALLEAVL